MKENNENILLEVAMLDSDETQERLETGGDTVYGYLTYSKPSMKPSQLPVLAPLVQFNFWMEGTVGQGDCLVGLKDGCDHDRGHGAPPTPLTIVRHNITDIQPPQTRIACKLHPVIHKWKDIQCQLGGLVLVSRLIKSVVSSRLNKYQGPGHIFKIFCCVG